MINMITSRYWIATVLSGLFFSTFFLNHLSTTISGKTDLRGSDVASVELVGPVNDIGDVEPIDPKSASRNLMSVLESPGAAVYTSQPIQTATLSQQSPQASSQPVPQDAPTIQKPIPPNFQGAGPSTVDQPIADDGAEDKNLDVLMRGQLHEAYAEVYQYDAQPSAIINRQPPEPIDEIPPEFKPDGEHVDWIPGYWAWDDQRNDFIWISGVWRNIPPGQRWVPGYWQTADAGYRWVSGCWIGDQQTQLDYLPQPPASLENGPVYPAPSEDHYYVPGNWVYQHSSYVWQSGYWAPRVATRVWIPARYIWTPQGCFYRPGFWDYEFDQRGVVFAPIYFNVPVYRQANYCYRPMYVINTDVDFMAYLFVRPNYCHYYFGDWYGPRYASQNFYPWSNYGYGNLNFRAYDPLFSYYRCRSTRYHNAQALGWVQNQFSFYFQYQSYRPPHTYREQREFKRQHDRDHAGNDAVRRASYGERYNDRISRQKRSDGGSRSYTKADAADRIDSLAISREISKRRGLQDQRPVSNIRDPRTTAKLDLPKSKPPSVKRRSVQLATDGRNLAQGREQNSKIRIPVDVRPKLEPTPRQQAEKRQSNRSTTSRTPGPKSDTRNRVTRQPQSRRPQESKKLSTTSRSPGPKSDTQSRVTRQPQPRPPQESRKLGTTSRSPAPKSDTRNRVTRQPQPRPPQESRKLSTTSRSPEPKSDTRNRATSQPQQKPPQKSRKLEKQPAPRTRKPDSPRIEATRKGKGNQGNRTQAQQAQRNQKNAGSRNQRAAKNSSKRKKD